MNQDMQLRLVITADGRAAVNVVKENEAGLQGLNTAQRTGAQATTAAKSAADQYIDALRKQVEQLRLANAATRENELRSKGATDAQLAEVRRLNSEIAQLGSASNATGGAVLGMIGRFASAGAAVAGVQAIASALTQARLEAERVQAIGYFANAGDVRAAGAAMEWAREKARELGLEVMTVSTSFMRFQAASRGSALTANQVRDIFEALLRAATTLRMTGPELEGSLLAVQQMMNKGTVQAEELRGQLGERLPGAYSIAARAMGVTEQQLGKLLETGQVVSADFLPKFAAQLQRDMGDAPERAAQGTQAALNRIENAWKTLKQEVAQLGGPDRAISAITAWFENLAAAVRIARTESKGLIDLLANLSKGLAAAGSGVQLNSSGRLEQERAEVKRLTEALRDLGMERAQVNNDAYTNKRLDAEIAAMQERIRGAMAVTTQLGKAQLAWESQFNRDARDRAEENSIAIREILDKRKASNDRYLKELAEAGDKKAKLDLANKQIDEKFAKDLADGTRTLAEIQALRAAEYKKIYGGDAKQAAEAAYREAITVQERLQAAIAAAVRDESDALKKQFDRGLITATEYYSALQALRMTALAQEEESVRKELALAEQMAAKDKAKKADVAKYLAELKEFGNKRLKITEDTEDNIAAAERKAEEARIKRQAEVNEIILQYARGTRDVIQSMLEAMRDETEQRQFDLSIMSMTEQQQARAQAMRQIELNTRKLLTQAYKDYLAAIDKVDTIAQEVELTNEYNARVVAIRNSAAAQKEVTAQLINQKEQLDLQKTFWDGLFNSIKGGWKGVRDFVKNFFFDWLINQLKQQFIVNIGYNLSGSGGIGGLVGGLFGGSGTGASGSALGSLLNVSGAGGGIAGLLGLGTTGGLLGGTALGAGYSLGAAGLAGGGLSGFASGVGMAFQGGFMSGLGSLLPIIGPLFAIGMLASSLLKGKDGLWFDINGRTPGGRPDNQFTTALGSTIQLHGEGNISDAKPYVAQFQNLAQNFVDIFGKEVAERAAAVVNAYWTGYSQRGRGTEYTNASEYAAALAQEGKDVLAEYFSRAFSVVDSRIAATISAWTGSTEELVTYIQTVLSVQASLTNQGPLLKSIIGESINLSQLVDLQKEGEKLSDTFNRVLNTFAITNQIAELLGKGADAFGAVGLASLEARDRVISLAGGLQALGSDVQAYLEKFFSEDERAAMQRELARKQVEAAFSDLNLQVPATREQFRALVNSLDLSTDSGQRAFVALMKISGAFDLLMGAAEESSDPVFSIVRQTRGFGEAAVTAAEQVTEAIATLTTDWAAFGVEVNTSLTASLQALFAVIDSTSESTEVKLQRKITATQAMIASISADLSATAPGTQAALALQLQLTALQNSLQGLTSDMARLTILRAQYGDRADALLALEHWRDEQMMLAQGNAVALLAIEQSYQVRRNEILTSGVASGLSTLQQTLRDWLNGLLLNQQLTTLTPMAQLAEARSQYEAAVASGDAAGISRAADAYLSIARSVYASGAMYQQIYDAVIAQVRALIAGQAPPPLPTAAPTMTATRLAQASGGSASSAASSAAQALNAAAATANDVLANLMAATKFAVEAEGRAARAAADANADKIVAAIDARGLQRVEV